MVDAGAVARNTRGSGSSVSGLKSADVSIAIVCPADTAALADYEIFCSTALHGQAQHPLWLHAWIAATNADALIATIRHEGRTKLMIAMEVVKSGPFRVARFMGGDHANGNFVATDPSGQNFVTASVLTALREAVAHARPDIDLICLERQLPDLSGMPNPFAQLATVQSANIALATDLSGGMDAMLARMNGKRKRKKLRYTLNKFSEAGGHRWLEASSAADVESLLARFFEMKALRFRQNGIPDPFSPMEVQSFFGTLFTQALQQKSAPFVLHGLEVGGRIVGVNGYSITKDSFVCEFCAIDDSEPSLSPGFYLDFVAMEKACEQGKAVYDFSVGDDDYKRTWCDIQTQPFDLLLPLTVKGRLAYAGRLARTRGISAVKSNTRVWTLLKTLRKKVSGYTS